jgi:large subunit ribosomal protein L29
MTDIADLRELGIEDLAKRVLDLDDQVFRLRMQQGTGQGDVPNKMRLIRRERARVKTLLREQELAAEGKR